MISIIVTFHNEEQSIISCLQSVVAQTAQQWECIIVDNGSTDSGEYQVRNYLIDRRMRFFREPERLDGAEVRERALAKAQGEWVMYLDGGDYLTSDALQALYLCLKKYGTLCAAGNYYVVRDGEKRPVSYRGEGLVRGRQVARGEVGVITGNSLFSRSVAHLPEAWPKLDFAYTDHLILVSGERSEPLVRVENEPFYKKIIKWLRSLAQ